VFRGLLDRPEDEMLTTADLRATNEAGRHQWFDQDSLEPIA
jgi:hypothetical protein